MRVLISGAGIAGLTLATLLAQQGKECTIIDRLPEGGDLGYVLALWPQGSRVLHALGVHDDFVARSEPMTRYILNGDRGRRVGTYDMQSAIGRFGHIGVIPRPEFVRLLAGAREAPAVRGDISIAGLRQVHDRIEASMSDGSADSFDLVVGADGMHSRVRELLYGRRWYADYCRTPIANGAATPRFPVVALIHSFMDCAAAGESRDALLGPPLCRIFERSATGSLPSDAPPPATLGLLARRGTKLAVWWMGGLARPNPFFDDVTKEPRSPPQLISPREVDRLER